MLGPALCRTAVFAVRRAAQAYARGRAPVSTMWEKFEPAVMKAAIRTAWPTTIKASPAAGTGPLRRARLSASARGRAAAGAAHQPSQDGQSQISTAYSAQLVTAAAVYAVLWLITKAAGTKRQSAAGPHPPKLPSTHSRSSACRRGRRPRGRWLLTDTVPAPPVCAGLRLPSRSPYWKSLIDRWELKGNIVMH